MVLYVASNLFLVSENIKIFSVCLIFITCPLHNNVKYVYNYSRALFRSSRILSIRAGEEKSVIDEFSKLKNKRTKM